MSDRPEIASNNFAETFLRSISLLIGVALSEGVCVRGDLGGFWIWDCVRTTNDSFDFGAAGEVRIGVPFLVVGITRFTRGVGGPCFVVFS